MTQKYTNSTPDSVAANKEKLLQMMHNLTGSRVESNWKSIADVTWVDLDFYVNQAKQRKDKDSFDTAIRVLEALRSQILGVKK